MKPDALHPNLKEALSREVNKSMPPALHNSIMAQIKASQTFSSLAVPTATPWVVIGLFFAIALIAAPFLLPMVESNYALPAVEVPQISLSVYMWVSILALICIVALNELRQPIIPKGLKI